MFDLENIKSGEDYANGVIEMLKESELEEPEFKRTPLDFMELWFAEIREYAEETWLSYLTGKREHFKFSFEEMMILYDKVNEKYVDETLESLLDKNIIQCSIGTDGGMLFSLTEKGKETVNKLK